MNMKGSKGMQKDFTGGYGSAFIQYFDIYGIVVGYFWIED